MPIMCNPLSAWCVCVCVSDFLKRPLEQYVRRLEVRVSVIRMEQRSGLIRARLKGASISTGQVCVYLLVPGLHTVLVCLNLSLDVISVSLGHNLSGCPLRMHHRLARASASAHQTRQVRRAQTHTHSASNRNVDMHGQQQRS